MPGPSAASRPEQGVTRPCMPVSSATGLHPLTNYVENQRLNNYEQDVKNAFDAIVPALKGISAIQHEVDFERKAQSIALDQLGFELPENMLADAWVDQLDMRKLYAWCVFETYQRFSDEFFATLSWSIAVSTRWIFLHAQMVAWHT
jgi:hypothetical protein